MSKAQKENMQFYKVNTKDSLLEISGSAFAIDKIRLGFRTYDKTKEKGNRLTKDIDIYMDIADFDLLCYRILDKSIQKTLVKNKKEAGGKYPKEAYSKLGGSTRDNVTTSTQFRIEVGMKAPIIFKALRGEGETKPNGLIVPKYKLNEAETVNIPMSYDEVIKFARMGEQAVNTYFRENYKTKPKNDLAEEK